MHRDRTVILLNQYYAPDEAATAQMLADLGEGLAATGARVVAIASDRSYADPSRRYPRRETIGGVEVRRVATTGFGRATRAGRVADYATFLLGAIRELARADEPDAVVSLTTPPLLALLGSFAGRLRGARTIFWSMDVYPDVAYELGAIRRGSLVGGAVALLARLTHRLPDVVVALGSTMKARLERDRPARVEVIHNWADGDAIRPLPPDASALRREWGWSDRFVILYSGNMGLGHEFETALRGIPDFEFRISNFGFGESSGAAPSSGGDVTRSGANSKSEIRNPKSPLLAFVGGGPRRAEVERRAIELGLIQQATLDPQIRNPKSETRNLLDIRPYVARERLGDSLTAGDVHLVTMREGMQGLIVPSKIYGILAAGRPTIYVGPAEGEIYDIVTGGACGVHVAIGDADGFARAVERYASDPTLVREHGANARRMFDERFTRARGIDEFRRVVFGRCGERRRAIGDGRKAMGDSRR